MKQKNQNKKLISIYHIREIDLQNEIKSLRKEIKLQNKSPHQISILNEIIKNFETENTFYKQKLDHMVNDRLEDFHREIETQYRNMMVRQGLQNDQILQLQQ